VQHLRDGRAHPGARAGRHDDDRDIGGGHDSLLLPRATVSVRGHAVDAVS
jgi:hypothetical protein